VFTCFDPAPETCDADGQQHVKPTRINELYQAAFTALPIAGHRRHSVLAVLDCFSRYLLVLQVSPTEAVTDLIKGLNQAHEEAQLVSDLPTDQTITLVTDTGPRLVTPVFSDYLAGSPFRLASPEPRTFRALGNIRRLLWTLKDEETSVNLYRDPEEARRSLELFRHTYNFDRPHQALGYKVPADLFCRRPGFGAVN
jgi:putative transposase